MSGTSEPVGLTTNWRLTPAWRAFGRTTSSTRALISSAVIVCAPLMSLARMASRGVFAVAMVKSGKLESEWCAALAQGVMADRPRVRGREEERRGLQARRQAYREFCRLWYVSLGNSGVLRKRAEGW